MQACSLVEAVRHDAGLNSISPQACAVLLGCDLGHDTHGDYPNAAGVSIPLPPALPGQDLGLFVGDQRHGLRQDVSIRFPGHITTRAPSSFSLGVTLEAGMFSPRQFAPRCSACSAVSQHPPVHFLLRLLDGFHTLIQLTHLLGDCDRCWRGRSKRRCGRRGSGRGTSPSSKAGVTSP